jgi:hypothetical protein
VALNWRGGTAPYFLSIIPGGQVSAAALIDFGTISGTSLTWTANITAGTSYVLKSKVIIMVSSADAVFLLSFDVLFTQYYPQAHWYVDRNPD